MLPFGEFTVRFLAVLVLCGILATPSAAQQPTDSREQFSLSAIGAPPGVAPDPWPFIVNGYTWLADRPGHVHLDGAGVPFEEEFPTLDGQLRLAAMFDRGVRQGPFGNVSPLLASLTGDKRVEGPDASTPQGHRRRNPRLSWISASATTSGGGLLGQDPGSPAGTVEPSADARSSPATDASSDDMADSGLLTADPRRFTLEPWRFTINFYGWMPQIPATIEIGHGDVQLPEKFHNILDDLQFTVMSDFEVRKGPFGVYLAPIVMFLKDTEHVQGPLQRHKVTVNEDVYLIDFGLSYEVGRWHLLEFADGSRVTREGKIPDTPTLTAEPFVGARWLLDDIRIKIDPGRSFTPDIHFIAPVVGLRTFWNLTEHFNARIEADYGGFDVDHLKETYDFAGALGYRWKAWELSWNFFAGYRYLHIRYKKKAEIKATVKGPFVGIGVEF